MVDGQKESLERQLVGYCHTGHSTFVSFEEEFEILGSCQLPQPGEAESSYVSGLVIEAFVGAESLEVENLGIRLGIWSFDADADVQQLQVDGRTAAFGEWS